MDNEDDFRVESTPNSSGDIYDMGQFDETTMGDSLYARSKNVVDDLAKAFAQANQNQFNQTPRKKHSLFEDEEKQAQEENTKATKEDTKASKDSTQATKDSTKATQSATKATEDSTKATKDDVKATQDETKSTAENTKATTEETKATKDGTKATNDSTKATKENTKSANKASQAIEKAVGQNTAALNRLADRFENVVEVAKTTANLPAMGFMSQTEAAWQQRAQAQEARDKAQFANISTVDHWIEKQDRAVREQYTREMGNPGMVEWAYAMPKQYIQYLELTNKIRNRKTTTDKNFNPSKKQADRLTAIREDGLPILDHDKNGWHTPSHGLFAEIGDPYAVWGNAQNIMRNTGEIPYKYVPQNLKDQLKDLIRERDTYLKQDRKFANFGTIDDLLKKDEDNTPKGFNYIPASTYLMYRLPNGDPDWEKLDAVDPTLHADWNKSREWDEEQERRGGIDTSKYIPDNMPYSLFGDERKLRPEVWNKSREQDEEYAGRAGLYVFTDQQIDDIQNGNLGSLPESMAEFVYANATPQTRMTMLAGGSDAVAALQEGAKKEAAQIAAGKNPNKPKKNKKTTTKKPKAKSAKPKTETKASWPWSKIEYSSDTEPLNKPNQSWSEIEYSSDTEPLTAPSPKINAETSKAKPKAKKTTKPKAKKPKKKSEPKVEEPKLHANAGGGSSDDEPPVNAQTDFDDDADWRKYRNKLRGDRSLGLNNAALADFITQHVQDVVHHRNITHWKSDVGGQLGDWGAELAERIAIIQNEKLTQYDEENGIYTNAEQKAKQFAKLIGQTGKNVRDHIRNTMAQQARANLGTMPVGSPWAIKYGTIEAQMKTVNNAKLRMMANTAYSEAQDYKRQADEEKQQDKLRQKEFKEQERQGAKEDRIKVDENKWRKWDKNHQFKARTLSEDELADMTEDELLEWIEAERVRTVKFNAERKAQYDATHSQKADRAGRAKVNKEGKDRITDQSDNGKKLKREWLKIHHPDEFMAQNLRNDLRMEAGTPINTYGWRSAIGDFGAGDGVTGQAHGWIMDKMFYHGERAMRWKLDMAKHFTADDLKDKGFKGAMARKIMTFKDANGNTITKAWADMTPEEQHMFQLATYRAGYMRIARWGRRLLPVVLAAAALGGGTAWVRDVRNRTLNNGTNVFQAGANTMEDAIFDVGHLFGFSANSGKDIREDRQEALTENYGIFSNRGMELINSNMWARSFGLTTEADKEYIREQVAMGKSAEQVRQSFLQLKQVSEQTGISFKNLSQDVAQQATAADKETGNSVGIVQGTAQADKALMAAGFETSSLGALSENQAFQWAEMMALGASGHSQAAAEAQGDPQLLLTEALKYNVFPQALQKFKNLEYSMSGGSEVMEANQLYQQGIKLNDFQTGVDTMYTQAKYGASTQQAETALNITLSDGLTGEIVNRGLYEGGLYDTTGTGKYFAMNNKGSQSAQGSNEG